MFAHQFANYWYKIFGKAKNVIPLHSATGKISNINIKRLRYGNEKNIPAFAPEKNQQARFPSENVDR